MPKKMSYKDKIEKLDKDVSILKRMRKVLISREITGMLWLSPTELIEMIEYVNNAIIARNRSKYTYRTIHKVKHEKEN